jgi:hypothetical protein
MKCNLEIWSAVISASFSMPALAQTVSEEQARGGAGGAMMTAPSAEEARLPEEPIKLSPLAPLPDFNSSGVQNSPEIRQTDPMGDALRIVTPFGPVVQTPPDAAGGQATGLPLPGGSGVMPAPGVDLQPGMDGR